MPQAAGHAFRYQVVRRDPNVRGVGAGTQSPDYNSPAAAAVVKYFQMKGAKAFLGEPPFSSSRARPLPVVYDEIHQWQHKLLSLTFRFLFSMAPSDTPIFRLCTSPGLQWLPVQNIDDDSQCLPSVPPIPFSGLTTTTAAA